MKTIFMFLSIIILVSPNKFFLGAIDTKTNSNVEERSHIFNSAASPPTDFQTNDQRLPCQLVGYMRARQYYADFCYECGMACFRRNMSLRKCTSFFCCCTINKIE
ncbi:hypothetical protein N665_1812s0007 [Sinapis alba]|nr:hypothetical protein N665_1812s0007 [Sinapis alba]